jgi:hypothetical protein
LGTRDVVIGHDLRTASLMSQPEYRFDLANPGEYALLGILYLILLARHAAPTPSPGAVLILRDYVLRICELPRQLLRPGSPALSAAVPRTGPASAARAPVIFPPACPAGTGT